MRGEDVPVFQFGPDHGRDLFFLHGYARRPDDYGLALEELGRRGFRVVAPFLFANHGLRRAPVTFWECAALGRRTLEALRAAGRISPRAVAFGHSTGAAVALTLAAMPVPPSAVLAVNPVQPSDRSIASFFLHSARMNWKLATGAAGDGRLGRRVLRESGVRFYANWLRSPCRGVALIGGLRGLRYDRMERWFRRSRSEEVPTRVLFGAGDEFYPSCDGIRDGWSRALGSVEVIELDDENSHEWMMIRPARLADHVERFLAESERAPS